MKLWKWYLSPYNAFVRGQSIRFWDDLNIKFRLDLDLGFISKTPVNNTVLYWHRYTTTSVNWHSRNFTTWCGFSSDFLNVPPTKCQKLGGLG